VTAVLRPVAAPFVAAPPGGARVRARLRVPPEDEAVLRAVGAHLGSLAGRDLAARCGEGRLDAKGKAVSRAGRKRALTAASSSRWAGAITRTSEDQVRLAEQNLRAGQASLQTRVRAIEARLAVPAGGKPGRTRGYATPAERHAKAVRLQALKARLGRVQRQLDTGAVSVVRGGKALLRKRGNLAAAGLTQARWRRQWESARLFLTADGEKDKVWGNETIRWNPDEGWLEVKLPAPLADLANRPHGRYRLSAPVTFSYRGDEVAAQAGSGAVRYDISHDPARDRWYIDASWKTAPAPVPSLDELRQHPVVAVDVNHGHLAAAAIAPDGNVLGVPATIPLRPGRAARQYPRRAAAGRHHHPHRRREGPRCPRHRHREPELRQSPRSRPREGRRPALPRPAGPAFPAADLRHPHRPVPRPPHPDGVQRRAIGHRHRPCLHLPVGSRALATAPAGASPQDDRAPRGSGGDRATRARPPGQAPRDREPGRPGGRGTASPGADQDHPGRRDPTQETRRPTRPPAAARR
jgi:hypothetical protein